MKHQNLNTPSFQHLCFFDKLDIELLQITITTFLKNEDGSAIVDNSSPALGGKGERPKKKIFTHKLKEKIYNVDAEKSESKLMMVMLTFPSISNA